MQVSLISSLPRNVSASPARRRALRVAAVATVGVASIAGAVAANAAAFSTTVDPAGHRFNASLVSGATASFIVGAVGVTCSRSSTGGQVPAAPANHNPSGPVGSPITNPTFTGSSSSCSTSVPFTTATTTTNSTNGSWSIGLQYSASGSTGTLTIPKGGVVTTTSGLASCTVTTAPTGPVTVAGVWTPGVGGAKPTLRFSGVTLPISVSGGFGCPTTATTATFSASYEITNTTSPTTTITVTP